MRKSSTDRSFDTKRAEEETVDENGLGVPTAATRHANGISDLVGSLSAVAVTRALGARPNQEKKVFL